MKKFIFSIASFLVGMFAQAQDFQGMAVYESKTSTAEFQARMGENRDISPEMKKRMEEGMKAMFEKTFILNFDKSASIYKEEEKLESPGGPQGGFSMRMASSMMGGGGTYYKDVKTKMYTVDKDFMGKEFLVKDSLPKLNWKMESETKKIGEYTCYKATAVVPASKSDFRNFRPKRRDEEKKDDKAKTDKKDETQKKTNFMDEVEMPKDVTVTAWYTPDIPVNQGPESYWGLPGLILEINDGKTVVLCSKVVLNPKDKVAIKPATKGDKVTQKQYDEIVVKKMEEFREMRGQGGPGQRGGTIRMN